MENQVIEKQFKKVRYVGWERSMTPHIEREKKTMLYNVGWDKENQRGWFELYDQESGGEDYYAEGSLGFDGNELTDYDGVFSLDDEIVKCLEKMGADVEQMKDDLDIN